MRRICTGVSCGHFVVLTGYVFAWITAVSGQFETDLTLQNVWERLSLSNDKCMIQCISSDEAPNKIKFSRRLDTGQGTRLPKYSQQYILGQPLFARILSMRKEDMLSRFGAYQCKVTKNGVTTEVVTLKLPPLSLAELDISPHYQVVNVGEDVELKVTVLKKHNLPIRWRHNGKKGQPAWDDQLTITLKNVKSSDAGVYECFYEGRRGESLHAIMRLVVRGCPSGFYGAACDQVCPPCYNGGVCHEQYGVCVCPPGFSGPHCQKACGGNHFGSDCSKQCSPPKNNTDMDDGCALYLFCKPDPYSCSCASGFKGAKCVDHCDPGWYGADCKQPCHCALGASACHRITGACNGGCAKGWRGESCEINDPTATAVIETTTSSYCPIGRYGASCEKDCHCAGGEPCNIVSGQCPSGCEDGWGKISCSACDTGRFGVNCEFHCHCAGGDISCDKDGFCLMGCEAGWAGFTCQQECTAGRFGQNCASTCHCLAGATACNRMNGRCSGDCEPGFMGKDCQILCPRNTYGVNCRENCSCLNNGNCNRIDGTCTCEGRWRGRHCNESEPQIVAATDEEVNTGQFVVISCTSDAVPEPEMNITCKDFSGLSFFVRPLEKSQYQAIMKVTPEEAGEHEFSCSAKNLHGFDVKIVTLTVIDPPMLQTAPDVVSSTNDSLTIQWKTWNYTEDSGGKPGDHIEYAVVYREVGGHMWTNYGGWIEDNSSVINGLDPYTDYEIAIKCKRPGIGGDGQPGPAAIARTECGDPPPHGIPEGFVPDVLSADSVRLIWRGPSDRMVRCELIGYTLEYHEEHKPEEKKTISLSATNEFDVYHLSPDTLYTFRLYPETAVSVSKYFTELIFRTTTGVPGPVQNLAYQAVDDMLNVTWNEPATFYGSIKEYAITYELVDRGHCGNSTADKHGIEIQTASSVDPMLTLENLLPYSTYLITVTAKSSAGEGESSSISAMTAETAPDVGASNVRTGKITQTSIEFFWDPIPCEFANGIVVEYEYTLVTSDIWESDDLPVFTKVKRSADVEMSLSKIVKGLSTVVEDLKPYVEYGFAVRGYTKVEPGPFSEFLFVRTKEDAPTAPRWLSIDQTGPSYVNLSWTKPRPANGVIKSYRIEHRATKDSSDVKTTVVEVNGNSSTLQQRIHANVTKLEGATDYVFKVQASTSAGWGEWSISLLARTLIGIPEKPENVTLIRCDENELELSWKPPSVSNGILESYRLTYGSGPNELHETEVDGSVTHVILQQLNESTHYTVTIQGETSAGYGQPATISCFTSTTGEAAPAVHAVESEITNETIGVTISAKTKPYTLKYQVIVEDSRNTEPIDENLLSDYESAVVEKGLPYYIAAELYPSDISSSEDTRFIVGDQKVWGGYKNVHLNPGHKYRIRVREISKKNDVLKSVMSEPEEQLAAGGEIFPTNYRGEQKILGLGLLPFILVVMCTFVVLFLLIFFPAVILCRRREKKKAGTAKFSNRNSGLSESLTWSVMYKVSERESTDGPLVSEGWKYSSNIDKSSLRRSKAYQKNCQGIPVENFAEYVRNAVANGKLSEEFKQLVSGQTAPWSIARKSENLKKNRYGNILPYDRSCVTLQPEPGVNDSDYINASYVDGYGRPHEYIVTQGPLEITVVDFWRMIWQENSPAIVMLTDLIENGKNKCYKYWPDDSMICGNIQVLVIHVEENTDFVVRTILMQKKDESRTHRVLQYQFTGWPDRTVPSTAYFLLRMIKKVRHDHPVLGGPVVVHCSAGAGRSGTYIALDALIQQANEEKRVDVFRLVNKARLQRINLVQTEEQYLFIHESLLEALLYEETSVPLEKVSQYLQQMRDSAPHCTKSLIKRQFQLLKDSQKREEASCAVTVALSEDNIFKNRDVMTVPADSSRIFLLPDSDSENADDYINAVVVPGFRKRDAYIVTQMPLKHTVEDFLRLLYQTKSSLILMLNELDVEDSDNYGQYWPDDEDCIHGDFEIQLVGFEDHEDYIIRMMRIMKLKEAPEKSHEVIQMQYKKWKQHLGALDDPSPMLNLIKAVDLWYQRSGGGPITVHCMDGATRCGLYCASAYVCAQVKAEGILDAYQAVKYIRINRPEFISTIEQYAFCFKIATEIENALPEKTQPTFGTFKRLQYKI